MFNVRTVPVLMVSILMTFFFQNCSKVGFSGDQNSAAVTTGNSVGEGGQPLGISPAPAIPVNFPGEDGVNGITGGHFDLDTSTKIYPAGAGTTNYHVHEYDKSHQTTTINFFNLIDSGFNNIQTTIPANKKFVLNVVNASLSPGGVLEINNSLIRVGDFKLFQVYTTGPAIDPDSVSLSEFRLGFSPDVLANNGLVPTDTKCVRANDPGKFGEYRNGAL
ncbi:MAG: hypothetical protein ACXWRE_10060, partial [Pseudobdellovibrionaceae bacterium]